MVLRSKDCHNDVITSLQAVIKRPLKDNTCSSTVYPRYHVTFYQVEILSTAYIFNIFLRFKCYFVYNFRISFMSKVL